MSEKEVGDLIALLRAAYEECDEKLRAQFDRSLSFGDGVFDRWERAKRLGFGQGTSIYNSALVYGSVRAGRNTWIGPFVVLDGSGGGVRIGNNCSISAGVYIYTHDTVRWAISGGAAHKKMGAVGIGDCCYVGSQTVITPGVSIGDQSVIAANSLVRKDVPRRTVVGGSPAKPLGRVEGEGREAQIVWDADPGSSV